MCSVAELLVGEVLTLEALLIRILSSVSLEQHLAEIAGSSIACGFKFTLSESVSFDAFSDRGFLKLGESSIIVDT